MFNNDYFKSILMKGWGATTTGEGDAQLNMFKRVDLGRAGDHLELMLNTDLCMAYQGNADLAASECRGNDCAEFDETGTPLKAQDHTCCAWIDPLTFYNMANDIYPRNRGFPQCGVSYNPRWFGRGRMQPLPNQDFLSERESCCDGEDAASFGDCDKTTQNPKGPALDYLMDFVKSENNWLETFAEAWKIGTNNNQGGDDGLTAIGSEDASLELDVPRCGANFRQCAFFRPVQIPGCLF